MICDLRFTICDRPAGLRRAAVQTVGGVIMASSTQAGGFASRKSSIINHQS
jgi:hypothetical protein